MENFYFSDRFHNDMETLFEELFDDESEVNDLEDDWSINVMTSKEEKVFEMTERFIIDSVLNKTDKFEDRLPFDDCLFEQVMDGIKDALKKGLNIEKINESMPTCFYKDVKAKITKKDFLDYIEKTK